MVLILLVPYRQTYDRHEEHDEQQAQDDPQLAHPLTG